MRHVVDGSRKVSQDCQEGSLLNCHLQDAVTLIGGEW